MAPPSDKEIQFKGPAIRKLGTDLVKAAEAHLTPAKTKLDSIGVGYPGFSVIGIPLALAHTVIGNQTAEKINKAKTQLGDWQIALNKTARTWEAADDKSATKTN